jgi:signal transduction histidine kinase
MFTNALSHERLTPLNAMLNLSEIAIQKLNLRENSSQRQSRVKNDSQTEESTLYESIT